MLRTDQGSNEGEIGFAGICNFLVGKTSRGSDVLVVKRPTCKTRQQTVQVMDGQNVMIPLSYVVVFLVGFNNWFRVHIIRAHNFPLVTEF